MSQNLAWTSELGDAYVNQQAGCYHDGSSHAAARESGRQTEHHDTGARIAHDGQGFDFEVGYRKSGRWG